MDQRDLIPDQRAKSLTAAEMTLQPRIIQAEPMVLRATRAAPAQPSLVPGALLLAAAHLIPNQPTTEQWQTLKQAILDLHNAA